MGRHSDSDEDYRRSKKKKRRVSRSRSRSSSGESRSSRRRKTKKSKHKKKSSRSVTPLSDRSYKSKRRSRSRDRRSRSRSRSRSPSKSYSRRSRSKSRSRYRSRSPSPVKSRSRRSHSRSRRRSRSRSKSPWPPRGRSFSRSPRRSRSRSRGPRSRRTSRSISPNRSNTDSKKEDPPIDPCSLVPGFAEMSTAKQAEIRLQMALKAAAAADEKLKQQGVIPQSTKSNISLTIDEQTRRTKAIEEIEDDGFSQMPFMSSKYEPNDGGRLNVHDEAIFGTSGSFDITSLIMKKEPTTSTSTSKGGESIMHPNLYVPQAEKMERWRRKLIAMRRKKLEGELMV